MREKITLASIFVTCLILLSGCSPIFDRMDRHLAQTRDISDEDMPADLREKIAENNRSETKMDYLKKSCQEISDRYTSRPRYYLREPISGFWETNVTKIWEGTADRPSTVQNYMLKLLLTKSGRFTEEDIITVNTYCGITPHQYLKVRVDGGEWVAVDVWDKERPHAFGELTC
jgi:hypothetical protein